MRRLVFIALIVLNVTAQPARSPEGKRIPKSTSPVARQETQEAEDGHTSPAKSASLHNQTVIYNDGTPRSNANANNANDDAQIQRRIGAYTKALVFIGFLQAIILGMHWWIFRRQTDHFKNSERAWIQVVITKLQGVKVQYRDLDNVWIWPDFINRGRTPARITKIVMRAHRIPKDPNLGPEPAPRLPPEPEYPPDQTISVELDTLQFPETGITPMAVNVWSTDFVAVEAGQEFLYVYGYVDYLDIGGTQRTTRFCELYWVPYGPGDPHPKGFISSVVIPRAYTKCT